jgi:alpha-tubulin suppressor-like RCC1 family protein
LTGLHGRGRRRARRTLVGALLSMLAALAFMIIPALVAPVVSYGASLAPVGLSGLQEVTPTPALRAAGQGAGAMRKPREPGISLTPSASEPYWACPESSCEAIVDPAPLTVDAGGRDRFELPDGKKLEGGGVKGGYDPQDLQSAYKIPTSGGEDETIALVDAYGYPTAEEDLAVYREKYGLPPCTKANGCFKKVNQAGEEANYPATNSGWDAESALDIEMVSAACPHCHIMLAEADNDEYGLHGTVETAARLGASEISNSYGSNEEYCGEECEENALAYDQPGIRVFVSSGDSGYDNEGGVVGERRAPDFPADLPSVIAVGGTVLHKASNARGWTEEAWSKAGSGCTSLWPKPAWQQDGGCATRMDDDVAAVAACESPVSTYSPEVVGSKTKSGWRLICGTSVSSPLVAGIEAHASDYARSLPGAEAFYEDPGGLFDVTAGSNGKCTPPEEHAYYCNARAGYDGPTGLGTPDGPLELTSAPPLAITTPARDVAEGDATLQASVDPQGGETTYHFEYGTSMSYGTSVPIPDASAGSGNAAVAVSQTISGLEPDTTYHYRVRATSAAGSSYGKDSTFSTAPPTVTAVTPADGRADGLDAVTITGTNLDGATTVEFGSQPAHKFTVSSETSITALTPVGGNGEVDVTVTTPTGTSETSAADRYTFVLGPTLGWGENEGALGNDTFDLDSHVPVEVSEVPEVVGLAAGEFDSFELLANGTVMGSGPATFGLTERSNISDVPVPICKVDVVDCPESDYLDEVSALAAGGEHVLALLRNGTVMAWGENQHGELGIKAESGAGVPTPVCTVFESTCEPEHVLKEVVAIAAGERFSLALLHDGTVMAWGENAAGELATGKSKGPEKCTPLGSKKVACSHIPLVVAGLSEVTAISAAGEHAMALLANGHVMAWGADSEGQLGDGASKTAATPTAVCASGELARCAHDLEGVSAVAAGDHTGLALLSDGDVLDWGSNYNGQLGDGSFTGPESCGSESCSRSPVAVSGLSEVSAIAAGSFDTSSMAVAGGDVMTWGGNSWGQLGDGTDAASDVPVHVCAAFASAPCPEGPYLSGEVSAIAVGGQRDLVGFKAPGP